MEYLDHILPDLDPPSGGLFATKPAYYAVGLEQTDGRPRPHTKVCYTRTQVEEACFAFSQAGYNSYYAQASFVSDVNGRTQANAGKLKAFWADIDVAKKSHSYATRDEALAGIASFVQATGLHPTYLVSSGVGFLLYWCLDKAIPAAAWTKMAGWLAKVMTDHGLVFDPSPAKDSARILRLPGTVNQKNGAVVEVLGGPGKVYQLEELIGRLNAFTPPTWMSEAPAVRTPTLVDRPAPAPATPNAVFSTPFGTGESTEPKADAKTVVSECRQMITAGVGTEPQWFAAMSVFRRCRNGREWAHAVSATDPARYVPEQTDRKFDHAAPNAPALCVTFDMHNPGVCPTCPYWGKIKSPIQTWPLRRPGVVTLPDTQEEPAPEPHTAGTLDLPPKFVYKLVPLATDDAYVNDDGCFWVEYRKDKDSWKRVLHHLTQSRLFYMKSVWAYKSGVSQRQHWFRVVNPDGHEESLVLDASVLSSAQQLMARLNAANIFAEPGQNNGKYFMEFMNAYLNSILGNKQMAEVAAAETFGWKDYDPDTGQKAGFAVGTGLITENGMEDLKFTGAAERIAQGLGAAGTLDGWKPVAGMYKTLDQKAAQLGICLAFAAPLMKYGSGVATSATYSLWSTQSGMGKTQLLRACASVWGSPDGQWIQRQASTVARMRQLAVLNHLPAFMDELTDVDDEDLYTLAYSLVGGQEKTKLKRNGVEMAETGTWNTVTFCTSNKSIKEAVAKEAGDSFASVVRVIEYECDFKSYEHEPTVQAYINECMAACVTNYGVAGPNFMYQLLKHKDRLTALTARIEHWANSHGFRNEERFMAYPLALAIKAGRWAVEWGILDYDMDALERWVLDEFVPHNRSHTQRQVKTTRQLLLDYMTQRQRNMLMVRSDVRDIPYSQTPTGFDPYVLYRPVNNDVLLRYAAKERRLYIAKSDLYSWCKKQGRSPDNFIKELRREGNLQIVALYYALTEGIVGATTPTITCYMMEGATLDRLGFNPSLPETPAAGTGANAALTSAFS